MTRTPQTHDTSASGTATGPLTAPVADVLPEHVLLRLLHDHCIASGDVEPDVELALQFASAIAAHQAVGEPILETPAFEGRDAPGDDDEAGEGSGASSDPEPSAAVPAEADAIDSTSPPHDSSEEDTLSDEFDAKLADEPVPDQPVTEASSGENENATDADTGTVSDEQALGELVGEAAIEHESEPSGDDNPKLDEPKAPGRGPQFEEAELGALMAEMGGSGAEPGAEEEQQELKDVFGDPDETTFAADEAADDGDAVATTDAEQADPVIEDLAEDHEAQSIATDDDGAIAQDSEQEQEVPEDQPPADVDTKVESDEEAQLEEAHESSTDDATSSTASDGEAPIDEVQVDDATLDDAAGEDSTAIAELASHEVHDAALASEESEQADAEEAPQDDAVAEAHTDDEPADDEPAEDEPARDELVGDPSDEAFDAASEATAAVVDASDEATPVVESPVDAPAADGAVIEPAAAANGTPSETAGAKTATDEEFALTNNTVDKVQDFLGDLKSALVEMAHRPQPTVDVEPLVEALQAGFDRSAEQAAQTSTAVASLSEHMTQFGRNIEGGVAKSIGVMQQSRQMSLGPGNGTAPEFVDDRGRSPAVVLGAISLIVLGWSILFWIKTGSPKLALGTLIGANAIACCLLLARRDRS